MKYCIARPINGIPINGNEYVLNDKKEIMEFDSKVACLDYIKKHIDTDEPEYYLWEIPDEGRDGYGIITKSGYRPERDDGEPTTADEFNQEEEWYK